MQRCLVNRSSVMACILVPALVSAAPILTLEPENQNQSFGREAAWLGDVNGDGFDDFLLVDRDQDGAGYSGRAYVYFGGSGLDAQADLILQQNATGMLSTALKGPFDFNGDGHGDIVLGAPFYDAAGMSNNGAVFVYYGGPHLDAVADVTIPGPWSNYQLGTAIASAGRFDPDDDYDDLAATINTGGGYGPPPTAYVYRGGPSPSTASYWGRSGDFGFQYSLTRAGDRNGDGRGDLAFGLPMQSGFWYHDGILTMAPEVGAVYMVHGGALRETYELLYDALSGTAWLGEYLDGDFDFNGDGLADVIATARYIGQSRVFLGDTDPAWYSVVALAPGEDVAALGDVDADGFDDVAVVGLDGVVYVFRGGTTADSEPDWSIAPEAPAEAYALKVWRAGDVNADGRADVLVTVRWSTGYGNSATRAYVYSGIGMVADVPTAPGGDGPLAWRGAWPNPLNPATEIAFFVARECRVQVRLFDVRGRLVRTAFDGTVAAGEHTVAWDGRDDQARRLPSATYKVQVVGLGRAVGGAVTLIK